MDKLENIKKMKKEIEKWNCTENEKYYFLGRFVMDEILSEKWGN